MNIPLDKLYNFLENTNGIDSLIYRFFPHGSKKQEDLLPLHSYDVEKTWMEQMVQPVVIYHDQEPLNFSLYQAESLWNKYVEDHGNKIRCRSPEFKKLVEPMHLRSRVMVVLNCYDKLLLCHSEKNSDQLDLYEQNGFVGVYWWAHAVISLDWFRYAEFDQDLTVNFENIQQDFLIYNRAWSGTREYRLYFAEQLVNYQLLNCCQTSFSTKDNNIDYKNYNFANEKLQIQRQDLENHFAPNLTTACYSADYHAPDYKNTAIEVVLETLFDDTRWHLTEKSLRPIACGRPFILAATPGSLQYLRSYGFQTFQGLIDESYDTIQDPQQRIHAILKEMQRISQLPAQEKRDLWAKLYAIAEQNKKLFFSRTWSEQIIEEYRCNFQQALAQAEQYKNASYWKQYWNLCHNDTLMIEERKNSPESVKIYAQQLNQLFGIDQ